MSANPSQRSIVVLRIIAGLLGLPPAVILFLSLLHGGFDPELIWFQSALATAAALFGSFALVGRIAKCRTAIAWALAGSTLLGITGFLLGYFQPGVFGAEGNLAPLMGVLWAGPIGVVAGALLGLAVGLVRIEAD